uniref:G-protein coupled receptors family 1 profile domain-containing protein n=1 Tax=Salmo trutta TaxID=8032 RepID=A0A674BRV9_SALTR
KTSSFSISSDIHLCFESVNGSCKRSIFPEAIQVLLYLLLGSMSVLTVSTPQPTNYLILSLAVSDLLLGVLVMPPSMVYLVESCWYFGDLFCKIHSSTDVMLCSASILNLSFIYIERYYAVCRPLHYRTKITAHVVVIMMVLTWTVPATVGFGTFWYLRNIIGQKCPRHCEGGCVFLQIKLSSTLASVMSFYILGVGMISIYLKIFLIALRQAQSIQGTTNHNSVGKSQTKATKTLALVMWIFLSFWTPFHVSNSIDPFISYSTPPVFFLTFIWNGYLNSTINPMVNVFYYSWFRSGFRMIISGEIFQPDSSII